jgi:hypothetical protein
MPVVAGGISLFPSAGINGICLNAGIVLSSSLGQSMLSFSPDLARQPRANLENTREIVISRAVFDSYEPGSPYGIGI